MKTKKLSAAEQQFVKEAQAHYFSVLYKMDGTPYAVGACKTGNVFTDEVVEDENGDETSTYWLA